MPSIQIGLVGDYNPIHVAHQAIPLALELAGRAAEVLVTPTWIPTESIVPEDAAAQLAAYDGLWCVPASPYRSTAGALAAIRFAREAQRPFLGTCGGFQHALLEYAHNVLGLTKAAHSETDPDAAMALITPLACSLVGQRGEIFFREGSRLRAIYGAPQAEEGYHCNYGLNPAYEQLLDGQPLTICARDAAHEVRAIELAGHPFYFATLFQPERSALTTMVHPLILAYVRAARGGEF